METKVKGDKIKEGSIPLSALSSDMNIPAYIDFVKTLSDKDINTTLSIPYTNKVVLITRNDTRTLNSGESTIYSNYGATFTFTALPNASTLELHIDGQGSLDVFGIKVYKDINKIKKEFLPDNIGGADWDVQDGEAGYIKNRTHYNSENTILQKIDNKNLGDINIKGYDRIHIIYDYKNGETDYIIIDVKNKYIIDSTLENWKNGYPDYYFNDDSFGLYVDDYDYDVLPNINVIGYITKQLDEKFIPDTVVKTTPQTLSDADKNQALANLGIENYFRQIKDKCTLHIQHDELSFDSENPNLVTGYSTGLDNLIKDIKSFLVNCFYYNEIGKLSTELGIFTCTEMYCDNLTDVHNATDIAISFGTPIFDNANFSSQIQIHYENDELLLFYFEL